MGRLLISPEFLDKFTIHVAKNFMNLPKIEIPLILGIWGGKGQGKTFQCNLAYKKLGINPIVMSAGELESGNAGEPAKLIRTRYREASDIIKKGKMCSLFINDLDAGAGRMGGTTQYTVNNQMCNATLMNIADNPTNVQLPGVYKTEEIPRVPIICTGNDFSTLYAPLIRDGRMEKFYWNPSRADRIGVATDIGITNLGKRLVNSKEGAVEFANPNVPPQPPRVRQPPCPGAGQRQPCPACRPVPRRRGAGRCRRLLHARGHQGARPVNTKYISLRGAASLRQHLILHLE